MGNSKKLGVSFTAIQALQYRWLMHYFNSRPDPLSVAFITLIISQRLFGFTTKFGKVDEPGEETIFSTPGRRVLMFDKISSTLSQHSARYKGMDRCNKGNGDVGYRLGYGGTHSRMLPHQTTLHCDTAICLVGFLWCWALCHCERYIFIEQAPQSDDITMLAVRWG